YFFFFFSSRRRHTGFSRDWSSDVCSSDLLLARLGPPDGGDGAGGLVTWTWRDGNGKAWRARVHEEIVVQLDEGFADAAITPRTASGPVSEPAGTRADRAPRQPRPRARRGRGARPPAARPAAEPIARGRPPERRRVAALRRSGAPGQRRPRARHVGAADSDARRAAVNARARHVGRQADRPTGRRHPIATERFALGAFRPRPAAVRSAREGHGSADG